MPCDTFGKCSCALFTFFTLQRVQQVKCSVRMSEGMDAFMRCEQDAWQSQAGYWIQTGLRSRWKNVLGRTVSRVEPWRRYNLAQPRLVPVFSVLLLYPLCSRNRFTLSNSNRLETVSLLQLLFFLPWLFLSELLSMCVLFSIGDRHPALFIFPLVWVSVFPPGGEVGQTLNGAVLPREAELVWNSL